MTYVLDIESHARFELSAQNRVQAYAEAKKIVIERSTEVKGTVRAYLYADLSTPLEGEKIKPIGIASATHGEPDGGWDLTLTPDPLAIWLKGETTKGAQ